MACGYRAATQEGKGTERGCATTTLQGKPSEPYKIAQVMGNESKKHPMHSNQLAWSVEKKCFMRAYMILWGEDDVIAFDKFRGCRGFWHDPMVYRSRLHLKRGLGDRHSWPFP